MAASGFKKALRWFPRSSAGSREEEDEGSNERNGLPRSHLDQVVPVTDLDEQPKALAVHVEPKTVALKVSMHCHGCARKVEKQISKLEGRGITIASQATDRTFVISSIARDDNSEFSLLDELVQE